MKYNSYIKASIYPTSLQSAVFNIPMVKLTSLENETVGLVDGRRRRSAGLCGAEHYLLTKQFHDFLRKNHTKIPLSRKSIFCLQPIPNLPNPSPSQATANSPFKVRDHGDAAVVFCHFWAV
jgi:hypothetical protein